MAAKAEDAAGIGDMKTLYSVTEQLCYENKPQGYIIRDKKNNPLTAIEDKLKRWAEHFHEVLNCEPTAICVPEPEVPVEELININILPKIRLRVLR